jgi:nucleotide-binding universal stress UspA family protein
MIKTILVASDLTDASVPALRHAMALAYQLGAGVVALHVTRPFEPSRWLARLSDKEQALLRTVAQREHEAALQLLDSQVRAPDLSRWEIPVRSIVQAGEPAEAISTAAREVAADMIVVGTHAREGLAHAVIGSVAERVVRAARCPVVVCRM